MKRTFSARVYNCLRGFQVPWPIAKQLGVWSTRKKNVDVVIKRGRGHVYSGPARLTSGTEIRSGKAVKQLKCGESITVTISPA
jgi:hypothetical protein